MPKESNIVFIPITVGIFCLQHRSASNDCHSSCIIVSLIMTSFICLLQYLPSLCPLLRHGKFKQAITVSF